MIRKGVVAIIRHSALPIGKIYECSNGTEGLALLKEKPKIDFVMTDIRMPEMNGLEFIRHMKQQNACPPAVIILSGYEEFEYAAEAMKLGASAYLLKPVDIDELIDTIKALYIEREEQEKRQYLENEVLSYKIKMILSGKGEEYFEEIKSYTLFNRPYCVRGIYANNHLVEREYAKYLADVGSTEERNCIKISEGPVLIEIIPKDSIQYECAEDVSAAYSAVHNTLNELVKAYEETLETGNYIVLHREPVVLFYDEIKALPYKKPPENKINQLTYLKTEWKAVDALLEEMFDTSVLMRYHYSYTDKLIGQIYHKVVEKHKNIVDEKLSAGLQSLSNGNIENYLSGLKMFLKQVNTCLNEDSGIRYESQTALEQALEYIHQNFYKDINMAVVANEVSLNYYYFSNLFREKTGESFVNYLRTIRIEYAKELLAEEDAKVQTVAKQCGFKDPKQFSKTFRYSTGISPKEYSRRQQSEYKGK